VRGGAYTLCDFSLIPLESRRTKSIGSCRFAVQTLLRGIQRVIRRGTVFCDA
jgi:hypothetical protein